MYNAIERVCITKYTVSKFKAQINSKNFCHKLSGIHTAASAKNMNLRTAHIYVQKMKTTPQIYWGKIVQYLPSIAKNRVA